MLGQLSAGKAASEVRSALRSVQFQKQEGNEVGVVIQNVIKFLLSFI